MVEMPRPNSFEVIAQAAPAAPAGRARGSRLIKRAAIVSVLLLGTAALGHYGHDYWTVGRFLESTDDAYVKADYTTVAPKVAGYLAEVLVHDNEPVKAGQLLARIDDRDFRVSLDQAKADVEATSAAIRNFEAEIDLQESIVSEAKATLASTAASLSYANADAQRYRELTRTGAGTVQRAQQTESVRAQTAAQLDRDRAAVAAAQHKIAVLSTSRDQAEAQHARALATAHQADLNLSYTKIVAAVEGTVGARTLRVGQYVTAGTQLMSVVPLDAAYVVANFKETQLAHVRAGQPVEIEVDGLGGLKLKGRVDSLSPASGLEFALLPPDNATGNFTKIVQRIPVRITIDDAPAGLLRAGMSVEPTIDTKAVPLAHRSADTKVDQVVRQAWVARTISNFLQAPAASAPQS